MTAAIIAFVPMADLPNRIRELRKARRLTLEQLGERLGCGITQVSDLERGVRELTYHWMRRVARALGVEAAELLLPEDHAAALTLEERSWLDRYRAASDSQREQLQRMSDVIAPYRAPPAEEAA